MKVDSVSSQQGTFTGLTTREIHHTETKRITDPIDLTRSQIEQIELDSPVAKLIPAMPRIRVVLVGEDGDLKNAQTIGAGSGTIISSNGAIVSVNHVPAVGAQEVTPSGFEFVSGTHALKNMKTWQALLGRNKNAILVADIPVLPKAKPLTTIFTPGNGIEERFNIEELGCKGNSRGATSFSKFYEGGIDYVTVPLKILAEDNQRDIMLAKIDVSDPKDPYPFARITDEIPRFVYSEGHPIGVAHPVLALGEVVNEDFSIKEVAQAFDAQMRIISAINAALGGKGFKPTNAADKLANVLSGGVAGIDLEPLVNFFNGAIISTNRIDHGSSGGFLGNESMEQVGITYIGLPVPFGSNALLRYAAGLLGFVPSELPLDAVTGSVPMKTKVIPFLEQNGFSVQRARDGEPIDLDGIAGRHERQEARSSLRTFILGEAQRKGEPLTEEQIEAKLGEAGLGETKVESASSNSSEPLQNTSTSQAFFFRGEDKECTFNSKPVEITSFEVKGKDLETEGLARIAFTVEVKLEDGSTVKVEDLIVNPREFSLDNNLDPDTKNVIVEYLTTHHDAIEALSRVQSEVEAINRGHGSQEWLNA
ncbi:MAG: hypothetical protein HYZ79_07025 [Candidatus Melainabacteria bacterium]|nr:hypothetical protein [Candidatus Melainabacteria bacterium]